MFEKLVAIEPVNLTPEGKKRLEEFAKEVHLYQDIPTSNEEIVTRIGDADAVLVSYTSRIEGSVLEAAPNLRYVGMCCSLYSEEAANVDIRKARELGITVTGVRDYGDQGVVEYVLSELIRYLQGFGGKRFCEKPIELSSIKAGIVGLGTTGTMIADALRVFGTSVSYFSRTRKPDAEGRGIGYLPLHDLLAQSDAVFLCLNKNVILLGEKEFEALGNHKILFNTSIAPGHEDEPLMRWLSVGDNEFFCDTRAAIAANPALFEGNPHVNCVNQSAGSTYEAMGRLSDKVLANIASFLG